MWPIWCLLRVSSFHFCIFNIWPVYCGGISVRILLHSQHWKHLSNEDSLGHTVHMISYLNNLLQWGYGPNGITWAYLELSSSSKSVSTREFTGFNRISLRCLWNIVKTNKKKFNHTIKYKHEHVIFFGHFQRTCENLLLSALTVGENLQF